MTEDCGKKFVEGVKKRIRDSIEPNEDRYVYFKRKHICHYGEYSNSAHEGTNPELLIKERKKLIEMQDDSWNIRDRMLGNILEMTAERKQDKEKIIKDMKEREKQSRMYQRLGSILTVLNYANITRLGLSAQLKDASTNTIWKYIQSTPESELKKIEWDYMEDQKTIATRSTEWNMLHFNQALR